MWREVRGHQVQVIPCKRRWPWMDWVNYGLKVYLKGPHSGKVIRVNGVQATHTQLGLVKVIEEMGGDLAVTDIPGCACCGRGYHPPIPIVEPKPSWVWPDLRLQDRQVYCNSSAHQETEPIKCERNCKGRFSMLRLVSKKLWRPCVHTSPWNIQ